MWSASILWKHWYKKMVKSIDKKYCCDQKNNTYNINKKTLLTWASSLLSHIYTPAMFAEHCGKCLRIKGRRERQRQYCKKDFGKISDIFWFYKVINYDIIITAFPFKCFGAECSGSCTRVRRPAMTSRSSTPTGTGSAWSTGSSCGSQTSATALYWRWGSSTSSWYAATSTMSTRWTASCWRRTATWSRTDPERMSCCDRSKSSAATEDLDRRQRSGEGSSSRTLSVIYLPYFIPVDVKTDCWMSWVWHSWRKKARKLYLKAKAADWTRESTLGGCWRPP